MSIGRFRYIDAHYLWIFGALLRHYDEDRPTHVGAVTACFIRDLVITSLLHVAAWHITSQLLRMSAHRNCISGSLSEILCGVLGDSIIFGAGR